MHHKYPQGSRMLPPGGKVIENMTFQISLNFGSIFRSILHRFGLHFGIPIWDTKSSNRVPKSPKVLQKHSRSIPGRPRTPKSSVGTPFWIQKVPLGMNKSSFLDPFSDTNSYMILSFQGRQTVSKWSHRQVYRRRKWEKDPKYTSTYDFRI